MKKNLFILVLLVLSIWVTGCQSPGSSGASASPMHNRLTAAEKRAGWQLLFDGETTSGWRGFRKAEFPKQGWVVEEGCLKHVAKGGGGDIITVQQFGDYELQWEWRIPAKANNGVKYLVTESRTDGVGHEYQMIDDQTFKDGKGGKHGTASFYDVLPPGDKRVKPPGEWNHSRIIVRGNQVEHWLNGDKVLAYELGSEALKNAIAQSKFKNTKGFGEKIRGHIMLTDHTDEAWFRNLKIREFKSR